MRRLKLAYALCGNAYTEAVARLFFANCCLLIHRSNVKKAKDRINRQGIFLLALLGRYTIFLLPRFEFCIAIPHSANKYNFALRILRPHKIYLIDDGVTFEYWSDFHNVNIAKIIERYFDCIELIGPRLPKWPSTYKSLTVNIVSRKEAVSKLLFLLPKTEYDFGFDKVKNLESVCVLDDGQFSMEILKKIADDFKIFCESEHCFILMHPSRRDDSMRYPAEIFIVNNSKNIKAVYGKASAALFNIYANNPHINCYSSSMTDEILNESLRETGIKILSWSIHDGFCK